MLGNLFELFLSCTGPTTSTPTSDYLRLECSSSYQVDATLLQLCSHPIASELRVVKNRAFISVPFSEGSLGVQFGALAYNFAEAMVSWREVLPSLKSISLKSRSQPMEMLEVRELPKVTYECTIASPSSKERILKTFVLEATWSKIGINPALAAGRCRKPQHRTQFQHQRSF